MPTLNSALTVAVQGEAPRDQKDKPTAKKVIERLLPDPQARRLVLQLVAEIVRKVAATNPATWGITLLSDEFKVNVGGRFAVVHVHPKKVSVYGDGVSGDEVLTSANQLKTEPDVKRFFLTHSEVAIWLPKLCPGIFAYVDCVLDKNYALMPSIRKSHAPGVLRYIEEELQLSNSLPDPTYPVPVLSKVILPPRYWRVGTREGKRIDRWPAMQEGGFASIGWGQLGDLRQRVAGLNRDAAIQNIAQSLLTISTIIKGSATRYANQWYAFSHEIQPGDTVVAMDGRKIVGIGEVAGEYVFESDDQLQPHHLPIVWSETPSHVWQSHPGYLTTVHDFTGNPGAVAYIGQLLSSENMTNPTPAPSTPLNQILYGPPGTGKTYNTLIKAVQILHDHTVTEMSDARPHWDSLRHEERIEFVTFHQSYGYEDFLEGLRPVVDDDEEVGLRYTIVDGALKRIALRALGAMLEPIPADTTMPTRTPFDILWTRLLEQIEQEPTKVYEGLTTGSKFHMRQSGRGGVLASNIINENPRSHSAPRDKMEDVFNELRDTDGAINTSHITKIFGESLQKNVAVVVFRELKRLEKEIQDNPGVLPLAPSPPIDRARSYMKSGERSGYCLNTANPPRYILVMDEINRGNISKIFGELITLIEDDKRIGARVPLFATLPLSAEKFALPPNLYLLGTMNTADKSIALVDIALRRRFDFVELMPDFDTCTGLTPLMRSVLDQLNHRITLYKDRDHQIGHAFFKGVGSTEGFNAVWKGKLLPLLQEYFYNDWDALRAVIGETGTDGKLIRALPTLPNMPRTRSKWQWYTDAGATLDPLDVLRKNYGIGASPEAITLDPAPQNPAPQNTEDTIDGTSDITT